MKELLKLCEGLTVEEEGYGEALSTIAADKESVNYMEFRAIAGFLNESELRKSGKKKTKDLVAQKSYLMVSTVSIFFLSATCYLYGFFNRFG